MKKLDIKSKEYKGLVKFDQLYAVINDEDELRVNGSVTVSDKSENLGYCKIYVNICRSDGAILFVLKDYECMN